MSTKEKARVQRQRITNSKSYTNSGRKLKTKTVVSKAFLSLPVRKSPEISVTCLSRKTNTKHSSNFSPSLKVKEKTRSDALGSIQQKRQQSRELSVCTQGRLAS